MTINTTTSLENTQANAAMLGRLIDSFLGIITTPNSVSNQQERSTFSRLKIAFEQNECLAKSLIVVRVENDASENEDDPSARLAHQALITQQLQAACGRSAYVAAIGDKEYAVLLQHIDQCSELIPRLENILSRTAAGHLNGDGASLVCRIGVARCPIDASDLGELIRMASTAAAELRDSELGFQFICQRHC